LSGFLRQSQTSGLSLVLVITGRGREGDETRGVLRRLVPLWLALPEMRGIVTGFQEAGTRQGGPGALYVRLRRRRP
jgi:DNA-nicking Smr family endonuclease